MANDTNDNGLVVMLQGAEAQTSRLADFLLARPGFAPQDEGAGDAAIRVIEALDADLAAAKAAASAHKGQATRARNEARVLRLEKSPTRRKCGPPPAADGEADVLARREAVRAAIYQGDHVDVVASDGKKALIEIAPERVNGDAWRERPDGFLLTSPIEHEPGEMDKPEVVVAGYGLFDAEGNQVGWRGLHDPIRVGSGQRVRVENSIIF